METEIIMQSVFALGILLFLFWQLLDPVFNSLPTSVKRYFVEIGLAKEVDNRENDNQTEE